MTDSDGIEKFIRPNLKGFTGYSASTSPDTLAGKVEVPLHNIIKMNANENPYGPSPKVVEALAKASNYHIYPDDGQQELRRLLSGLRLSLASGTSDQTSFPKNFPLFP